MRLLACSEDNSSLQSQRQLAILDPLCISTLFCLPHACFAEKNPTKLQKFSWNALLFMREAAVVLGI